MEQNTGKKILIAEDDGFLSKIYDVKLKGMGYNVVMASDGEDALEKLNQGGYNLIILDMMMPKRDGFDVLAAVRANQALSSVPVIVLSNLGQESDVKKAMDMGANDYLIKANFSIDEVVSKIKKHLGE